LPADDFPFTAAFFDLVPEAGVRGASQFERGVLCDEHGVGLREGTVAPEGDRRVRLLRANALVAGDLSLPVVLRQNTGAARDLLGARYTALGVLGRDGELEQFVRDGMDDALVAEIGDLPSGRGILGLLTSEPVPIRLADLSAHPAAAGFPAGQPPMRSFAAVPVRIGEEVFGNLYLTERAAGGEFTADDEELAVAVAAAAGAATANARPYAESEQRRRWLDATAQLTPLLLADNREQPHALITGHAAAAAGADFAIVAVPRDPGQVIVTGAAGPLAAGPVNRTGPLDGSLAGQVISTGKPSLVTGDRLETAAAALGAGPADGRPAGRRRADSRRAAARPDIGGPRVHRDRPGHGRILRRAHRGGHGTRRGPRRPGAAGPGRRRRPHRGRPARPRHPGILAVTREALSNCARHARATAVSISLTRHDDLITLEVTDNGRGLGAPTRSSGLASMRRRAENNGGTLQTSAPPAAAPGSPGPPAHAATKGPSGHAALSAADFTGGPGRGPGFRR
jgi:hypothetical protein